MPRCARIVVPGYPHHVTQRGIRKATTFFDSTDYLTYLELLRELRQSAGVTIWAYCLMPNHIHMVVVPDSESGLAKLFRPLHSRYALRVNAAHGWQGHLWQERFYSVAMDETHTLAAMRYVEMNPVRAGLCSDPEDWRWSSIHAHLAEREHELVDIGATKEIVSDWRPYLQQATPGSLQDSLRKQTRTGRPSGDSRFIGELERITGKPLTPRKPGPQSRS